MGFTGLVGCDILLTLDVEPPRFLHFMNVLNLKFRFALLIP
jgi:hypothetical protein